MCLLAVKAICKNGRNKVCSYSIHVYLCVKAKQTLITSEGSIITLIVPMLQASGGKNSRQK